MTKIADKCQLLFFKHYISMVTMDESFCSNVLGRILNFWRTFMIREEILSSSNPV